MSEPVDFSNWVCPLPLRDYPAVVLGHGGGGKLSAELVENIFLPAFANATLAGLGDSAVLELPSLLQAGARLAFSTDSYVVNPLFFPGGNIGDLAINGTVNDIAMSGAQPLFLSAGFIIEEGLEIATLGRIAATMGAAAQAAGVKLVTGDTKVVNRGKGDGLFINTSGIGVIPPGVNIGPQLAQPGDAVLVSGELGLHGMAIMSVREGLEFESVIASDSAPLNGLVAAMLAVTPEVHALRDPTRGGAASTLNEIAKASKVGIVLDERALPVPPAVRAACEFLGLDPLYVANEGKLIALVPAAHADAVLAAMRQHSAGQRATKIGHVTDQHPGLVVAKTGIGGTRVVDMMLGEQLPRIC